MRKTGKRSPAQIYLLAMDGGEAQPLTDMPEGSSRVGVVADGHSIALHDNASKRFSGEERNPKKTMYG